MREDVTMIQVRFHGRGGHGIKTAGHILGTAAFLRGYVAQDAPVYGAERRGAPMVVFTRISDRPILARGAMPHPDLVIIADETLLADPQADPLSGVNHNSVVFVNTTATPAELQDRIAIPGGLITMDVTTRVTAALGSAHALSGALGGIACRLLGTIHVDLMKRAVREELEMIGLSAATVAANIALAEACYQAMPPAVWDGRVEGRRSSRSDRVIVMTYHGASAGTPSIVAQANARLRRTGNWRFTRPVVDLSRCTRCQICGIRCPDGSITFDLQGYPHIDYEQCKGCLICVEECPAHVIMQHPEKEMSRP